VKASPSIDNLARGKSKSDVDLQHNNSNSVFSADSDFVSSMKRSLSGSRIGQINTIVAEVGLWLFSVDLLLHRNS
jgi:hypothetical protein